MPTEYECVVQNKTTDMIILSYEIDRGEKRQYFKICHLNRDVRAPPRSVLASHQLKSMN